jgi:tRNA (adenine57-N1/adenine58-N1)-methyltransferase
MARITPGDSVLFYHDERLSYIRRIQEKGDFECHKGRIPWSTILEKGYGEEVKTHMGVSFILLKPSLADLMKGVERRTTIAYPKDAGYILLRASITPGTRIAEVGSGSGALTFLLASFVKPEGHVYSFERRPEFLEIARRNVERLKVSDYVTFGIRDVEREGFGVNELDVCIVDVPEPWTIVPHAVNALSAGGRWVSLSPTTEQLQETRKALESAGFVRFEVIETLQREMKIRPQGSRPTERMISHTVYVAFADLPGHIQQINNISEKDESVDNSPPKDKLGEEIVNAQEE